MTKAATQHEATPAEVELEPSEEGSPIGRNEYRWAARELRREAQGYRWRSRLAEILEGVGDLESMVIKKQAQLTDLANDEARLAETVAGATDKAAKIIAAAEAKAAKIEHDAAAAATSARQELDGLQEKRARKLAELEDADRRLRDTRKSLADLRKNLGGEEAPAA